VDSEKHHDLMTRLANYTIVNSVYQQYNNLKNISPMLKTGLDTAESASSTLVGYAQPVIQPVITKLDNALHLEEKANKVLDKTEELGTKVATAYQIGKVQSENLKDAVVHNYENAKERVNNLVGAVGSIGVNYTNKPINQLLDVTESVVDSILPPELELEPLDIHEETSQADPSTEKTPTPQERLEANPLPRIKQLGGGVSKRVKRVALAKLQNLNFRTPSQTNAMGYVVDLIQYTADYIDIDQKRQALKGVGDNLQQFFEEKKEQTAKFVSPAREIIEKQTADIEEQSVKAVVSIVSSIAHTTEVVRRQFAGQLPDYNQLQSNLAQITARAKESILKLKEPQLSEYIAYVRSTYSSALESLLNVTNAYTPALSALPFYASVDGHLQSWRDSILARITYHPVSANPNEIQVNPVAPMSPLKPIGPDNITPPTTPVVAEEQRDSPVVNST